VVYSVSSEIFTFGAKIHIYDSFDREIYYIEQKVFRFLPEYHIYSQGRLIAVIKKELSFFKPNIVIESEIGSFNITGDIFALSFDISYNGNIIGRIDKKLFSFTDSYCLQIDDESNAGLFVALVLAIDNCLHNSSNN